jgi:hypothetical protein
MPGARNRAGHLATAIMAVARAWTVLAQHVAHYDAIVNAENK